MKNIFLAFVIALIAVPAFAGSCPCEKVVTKTVVTTTEVVQAPVRVLRGLRARVAARRVARLEVRAARAEAVAASCCPAEACECEPAKAE